MMTRTFLKLGEVTRNNRFYPEKEVQRMLECLAPSFRTMGVPGYIGQLDNYKEVLAVPLDRISHRVHNLRLEAGALRGEVQVLDTPQGLLLQQLIGEREPRDVDFCTAMLCQVDLYEGVQMVRDATLASIYALPAAPAA